MEKEAKRNLKDILWGTFWVGLFVAPTVYGILELRRNKKNDDKHL